MNAAITNLLTRRACRSYKADVPERALIEKVIEAGLYAPSGMGQQSPIIVAVSNPALRDKLSALNAGFIPNYDGDPFYGAPVVLVVLAKKEVKTAVYDGALVMGNLMNAAHALGLASCWIHRAEPVFNTEEGRRILSDLGVEGDYIGIGHCILGYSAETVPAEAAPRKLNRVFFAE